MSPVVGKLQSGAWGCLFHRRACGWGTGGGGVVEFYIGTPILQWHTIHQGLYLHTFLKIAWRGTWASLRNHRMSSLTFPAANTCPLSSGAPSHERVCPTVSITEAGSVPVILLVGKTVIRSKGIWFEVCNQDESLGSPNFWPTPRLANAFLFKEKGVEKWKLLLTLLVSSQ